MMRDTVMQCREHLTGDEGSLLIRAVDGDLIGDVGTIRLHASHSSRKE